MTLDDLQGGDFFFFLISLSSKGNALITKQIEKCMASSLLDFIGHLCIQSCMPWASCRPLRRPTTTSLWSHCSISWSHCQSSHISYLAYPWSVGNIKTATFSCAYSAISFLAKPKCGMGETLVMFLVPCRHLHKVRGRSQLYSSASTVKYTYSWCTVLSRWIRAPTVRLEAEADWLPTLPVCPGWTCGRWMNWRPLDGCLIFCKLLLSAHTHCLSFS